MIISASRRTDVPAFFGDWFVNRIREGYFYNINPFNPKNIRRISLLPSDVDAVVFWSKNPAPFMRNLNELDNLGFNYYFQFTLNGYDRIFEPKLPALQDRINTFRALSDRIGANRVLWRYDPIIVSTITPLEYHLEKISFISNQLKDRTDRLTISFMDYYGKVEARLRNITKDRGVEFKDIIMDANRQGLFEFCSKISHIANSNGMKVFSCSEAIDLQHVGIVHGSCIDAELIKTVFKLDKPILKDSNQRPGCLCAKSVDVGVYNTCSFQCVYCYANHSEQSILNNLIKHRADSKVLIGEHTEESTINVERKNKFNQISIFD